MVFLASILFSLAAFCIDANRLMTFLSTSMRSVREFILLVTYIILRKDSWGFQFIDSLQFFYINTRVISIQVPLFNICFTWLQGRKKLKNVKWLPMSYDTACSLAELLLILFIKIIIKLDKAIKSRLFLTKRSRKNLPGCKRGSSKEVFLEREARVEKCSFCRTLVCTST